MCAQGRRHPLLFANSGLQGRADGATRTHPRVLHVRRELHLGFTWARACGQTPWSRCWAGRRRQGRCYISGVVRRRLLQALLVLVVLSVSSTLACGYHLLRASDAQRLTVSVQTLENDSVEPGVEVTVTRALRQVFLRQPAPRLVSQESPADLVIRGRVLPIKTRVESFDTVSMAIEYRVEMTLVLEVRDAAGRSVPIERKALQQTELYLASADVEAARKNREEALRRIAEVLAGRIRDAIGLQLAGLGSLGRES